MKITSCVKRATAALFAGAVLMTQAAVLPQFAIQVEAASLCTVNTGKTYQKIQGFGGMNLPEWIGDLTSEQRQKVFGNGKDELGFTILRIFVNDDKNQWNKAVATAKYAQSQGATVFATPWNPPSSMRKNGNKDIYSGTYQLKKDSWSAYANHLNSFIKYMEGQGVNLYSVSVQNEPDYAAEWTYWSTSDLTNFIAQYGKQVTSGTKAKLMSPESFQYRKDIYNSILGNQTAFNNIGVFGTHFYGTQRSQMDFSALENCGKPIWMTEVYVPNSNHDADLWPEAVEVAQNIHNGLTVGNMSAYVWWYIRRSYGPLKENGQISKRGYCMAQYSKFVRPGDVRVDVTEQPTSGVYVSAYKNSKGQVTIVAVNNSDTGYAQQFSVGSNTLADVDRWRTTSSENLAETDNLTIDSSGNTFWAQLPARSVSTFVCTLKGGSSNNNNNNNNNDQNEETTLDADGYYFHDTFEDDLGKWQKHGDTTLLKSGRNPYKGNEAMVVTERTSAWMGAERTLSSAFVPGKAYSFSMNVCEMDGDSTDTYYLKLTYKDSSGNQRYSTIAEGTAPNGKYVQLANTNYTIPSDAKDAVIFVETKDSTTNYYIDEAIGAPAGKYIQGAGQPEIPQNNNNNNNNNSALTYPDSIWVDYNQTYHQVRFTWNAVQNAQNYGIAVYLAGRWRIQTQSISSSTTTYTTPKNMTPGMTYKVAIAAKVNGSWDVANAIKHAVTITVQ
ncbi:carbohydrate binding domain-containing protein [Ruminococcus sp.]|uniref:carbohydrate binding domain-containing protein n=1 Tax=Ruminococcus sp. TaxID=41978 RepID=UPI0025D73066|nr:carbohydrate binding domain-containing protein [Ruminococcus sp.]